MNLNYKTIKHPASASFTEKKSEFIGNIAPVKTQAEAEKFIAEISKKHSSASHNVFAYQLREGGIRRYSDNGEPQGTAGIPTLDVLIKENLTDVCVVVTRYFGGILLGGGGLVRAYSHAVTIAVQAGEVQTMSLCNAISIECEYGFYGKLANFLPNFNAVVQKSDFGALVSLEILIRTDRLEGFIKAITELSNGQVKPIITAELYEEME